MRVRAHARQQQSVAAAAKLFSRESCDGITARHFPSKEQLYWAAGSQQVQHPPFCRAPLSSALPERELSQHLIRIYTADLRELISTCIGQGAGRGWQRKTDSEVGAGGFMEMALCRSLIQELFAGDRHQKPDPRRLGSQLTDIWLDGALAGQNMRGPRPKLKDWARVAQNSAGNSFHHVRKLGGAFAQRATPL